MKKVIIESPLSGNFKRNIRYARLCMTDCLRRGEAPYASHLLMTQILDDLVPEARNLGMQCGFVWAEVADIIAVYQDLGISNGMKQGIEQHGRKHVSVEYRNLSQDLMDLLDVNDTVVVKPTQGIES
jgi:hypothetical protein